MYGWLAFALGSIAIVWYSWPSLRRPRSHGFFRFFAWEAMLGLLLINLRGWFADPLAWHQLVSWVLLFGSLVPACYGFFLLVSRGKPTGSFEATTRLVRTGIYRYLRHPLYASLLYLTWGFFFKSPSLLDGCLAAVASAFLYATARAEENECLAKFGSEYTEYMQGTKMFIPFVF